MRWINGFVFNYSNDEGLGFWTLQSYFFEIHRQNHHCLSPTTIPLSGRYLNFVNYAHTIFFSDLDQIAQLCRKAQSGAWGSPQQARNRRPRASGLSAVSALWGPQCIACRFSLCHYFCIKKIFLLKCPIYLLAYVISKCKQSHSMELHPLRFQGVDAFRIVKTAILTQRARHLMQSHIEKAG